MGFPDNAKVSVCVSNPSSKKVEHNISNYMGRYSRRIQWSNKGVDKFKDEKLSLT